MVFPRRNYRTYLGYVQLSNYTQTCVSMQHSSKGDNRSKTKIQMASELSFFTFIASKPDLFLLLYTNHVHTPTPFYSSAVIYNPAKLIGTDNVDTVDRTSDTQFCRSSIPKYCSEQVGSKLKLKLAALWEIGVFNNLPHKIQ